VLGGVREAQVAPLVRQAARSSEDEGTGAAQGVVIRGAGTPRRRSAVASRNRARSFLVQRSVNAPTAPPRFGAGACSCVDAGVPICRTSKLVCPVHAPSSSRRRPCDSALPGRRAASEPRRKARVQERTPLSWRSGRRKPQAMPRLHHRSHLPTSLLRPRRPAEHAVADEGAEQGEGPLGVDVRDVPARSAYKPGRPRAVGLQCGTWHGPRQRRRAHPLRAATREHVT
jgi:hypothetical protein